MSEQSYMVIIMKQYTSLMMKIYTVETIMYKYEQSGVEKWN